MNMLNGDEAMSPAEFAKLMGAYPQPAENPLPAYGGYMDNSLLILHGSITTLILVQKGVGINYLSISRLILPLRQWMALATQAKKDSTNHTEKWR